MRYPDISISNDSQVPLVPTSSEPQILNDSRLGQLTILTFFIFLNVNDVNEVSPVIENSDTALPFSSNTPVILNSLIDVLISEKLPGTSCTTKAFNVVNDLLLKPLICKSSEVNNGLPAILILFLELTDDIFNEVKFGKLEKSPLNPLVDISIDEIELPIRGLLSFFNVKVPLYVGILSFIFFTDTDSILKPPV